MGQSCGDMVLSLYSTNDFDYVLLKVYTVHCCTRNRIGSLWGRFVFIAVC